MDQTNVIDIAQKYAETVKNSFGTQKMILFGSYAKGNYTKDSDIDIAVVFPDYENHWDRQVELMKLTRNIDTRIEPHPFRESDFETSDPLVYEIMKYGQQIV